MRKSVGITVFGCEQDEANAFRALSPDFHIIPTLISDAISADNAKLAAGNQCVSVGHKSEVSEATILALRKVGVKYISTRSIGCDHIDTTAAERMGISVGTVAYSPDSVADYALMLMLMAIRGAKPTMHAVAQQDFRLDRIRGKELGDMTVGVIGTGHIGQAVVKRLRGFG
ncbi:TPA: D-lactate dehydrogenase VanH-B, partial [Enterococcus faecium]|nr:D-lactate dehydrogenase VanH-B [Enterococcus faecium]HBK6891469.1 D-lactate dehydrogenase VanH-B [Enterococcus faecium]